MKIYEAVDCCLSQVAEPRPLAELLTRQRRSDVANLLIMPDE